MPVDREYKSTVFSFIFSDPARFLSLFCALTGVTLPLQISVRLYALEGGAILH